MAGRKRLYADSAEKQRAYRERRAQLQAERENEARAVIGTARMLAREIRSAARRGSLFAQRFDAEKDSDVLSLLFRHFSYEDAPFTDGCLPEL